MFIQLVFKTSVVGHTLAGLFIRILSANNMCSLLHRYKLQGFILSL